MKPLCIADAGSLRTKRSPLCMGCRIPAFHTHFCRSGPLYSLLKHVICVWTCQYRKTIHSFSRNHVYHFRNMQEPYTRQPVREVISIRETALLCMTDRESAIDTQKQNNRKISKPRRLCFDHLAAAFLPENRKAETKRRKRSGGDEEAEISTGDVTTQVRLELNIVSSIRTRYNY